MPIESIMTKYYGERYDRAMNIHLAKNDYPKFGKGA
jgi:hypothetical protein